MDTQVEVQQTAEPSSLLRRALMGNAVFSAASGAILIVAAPSLAPIMGVPWPAGLTVTGVILLPYALALWRLATQPEPSATMAWEAVILDVLWVVGSVALLLGGWLPLTTAGKWIIALLADAVALFAVLQFVGIRRLAAGD